MKKIRHKFTPKTAPNSYHRLHTKKRPHARIVSRKQEKMGLTTMDTLWWGSVFVFGGGCVAAVRTGANKDSAYGKWKQKRERKRSAESVGGEEEEEGREEIEREKRERERASSR